MMMMMMMMNDSQLLQPTSSVVSIVGNFVRTIKDFGTLPGSRLMTSWRKDNRPG